LKAEDAVKPPIPLFSIDLMLSD
jgi:dynein heavy chain